MRDRELLFGKLAIGRGALARPDAVRCFQQGQPKRPLWDVAVSSGLIAPEQVKSILALIDRGDLVCHGSCRGRFRIADLTPAATERCGACGGPLYVSRDGALDDTATDPRPRAPAAEPDLLLDDALAAPSAPPIDHGDAFDIHGSTRKDASFGTEVANLRATGQAPPPSPPRQPSPPRVPTVVAARAPTPVVTPAAPRSPAEEDTKEERADGFEPFSVAGFDVLAPLGRGGMGSVYRARQTSLGRVVALKFLETEDTDQRARFQREIHAIAKLDHKNIVKVYAAGEVKEDGPLQGKPFFAMDYVDGRDLLAWSRERPRTIQEIAKMVASICDAMEYAHGKLIIHRDLKPQNILVGRGDDMPKICDFGLAQVKLEQNQLTRTGDVMGTPQYMPPEQALGDRKKIGPPTDVYALGAILYELLCGRPPFVATKLHALIAMVVRDKPIAPSQLKNDPSLAPIDAVVLKALEKDPVKRFHTSGELGRAIRAAARI